MHFSYCNFTFSIHLLILHIHILFEFFSKREEQISKIQNFTTYCLSQLNEDVLFCFFKMNESIQVIWFSNPCCMSSVFPASGSCSAAPTAPYAGCSHTSPCFHMCCCLCLTQNIFQSSVQALSSRRILLYPPTPSTLLYFSDDTQAKFYLQHHSSNTHTINQEKLRILCIR